MQRYQKVLLFCSLIFAIGFALAFFSLSTHTTTAQDNPEQAHKDAVMRIIDEGFNQGNVDVLDEVTADDYVSYSSDGSTQNRDDFKDSITAFRGAIPDLQASADPLLADGDWVAFRFTMTGTFQNDLVFPGADPISATGGPINYTANIMIRFDENGKMVEEWDEFDFLTFFEQLGILDDFIGMMSATQEAPAQ